MRRLEHQQAIAMYTTDDDDDDVDDGFWPTCVVDQPLVR